VKARLLISPTIIFFLTAAACGGTASLDEGSQVSDDAPAAQADGARSRTISQTETGLLAQIDADDPVVRKRALARLGLLYDEEERHEEATAMLERAIEEYAELRPFLQLRMITLLSALERWDEAVGIARDIIGEAPETAAATTARIRLPALLAQAGETEAASRAVGAVLQLPIDELTEADHVATADILANKGMITEANRIRDRVLRTYTRGRHTEKLYEQLDALPPADSPLRKLSWQESLELAENLRLANRHPQSQAWIARIRERFPSRASDPALVWIEAQTLFNSRRYSDMQRLSIPTGQPNHVSLDRLKGHALWRLGRNQEFLQSMQHILTEHPSSDEATRARLLTGRYYLIDGNDYARAARYLQEGIEAGGAGTGGENIWTLAWIHVTSGDDQRALQVMRDYLQRFPKGTYATNSLFWSAKLHEKRGAVEERDRILRDLIRRFPYAYYSFRARELLGLPLVAPAEVDSGHRFPSFTVAQAFGGNPKLTIVRELEAIGLDEEATQQYREVVGANPEDPILAYGLADRYAKSGEPLRAIILLNRHFSDLVQHGGRDIPDRFWKILYPRHHWEEIQRAAASQNIDPYLVTAIIRQESGWDDSIVSSAGAVGLMQIMPEESAALGRAAGFDRNITRSDLFDPLVNIRVGAAEIRQKLDAMKGSRPLALASYNAGETPVRRWLGSTPIDDIDFFIDSIPFNETRRYVMVVTRNLYEYKRIYGEEPPSQTTAPR
jgi:soluble lytic murein transglycosylase-like protein